MDGSRIRRSMDYVRSPQISPHPAPGPHIAPPIMYRRGDDREITYQSEREEPGLLEWIRKNCLRVRVPDPNVENRHKAILNASHWTSDLRRQSAAIKPEVLIKVLPETNYGWYLMKQEYIPETDDFIPVQINIDNGWGDGRSEAMIKLESKARSVDIRRIGHITLVKPKYISPQLLATYVRYGVAEALLNNTVNVEGQCCVRDFLVEKDFLDGNYDRLHGYEWHQPPSAREYNTYGSMITLYTTSRVCNNDRKNYFVYGLKNLKYSGIPRKKDEVGGVVASVGGPAEIFLSRIDIRRSDVKTVEVLDTSLINDMGALFFQKPVLFKRGDDMRINGWLKNNAMGKTDNIRPLGFVVESMDGGVL